jgi:hypothetical protein
MNTTDKLYKDLPKVKRIIYSVIACQILGAIAGRLVNYHYSPFSNEWMGAALATPVGYFVGLWWHLTAKQDNRAIGTTIFLGIIAVGIGASVALFFLPESIREMEYLNRVRVLNPREIEKISIYDKYGEKHLMDLENPQIISAFTTACTDIQGDDSTRPVYSASWYLIIYGETKMELECHYQDDGSGRVMGNFVKKRDKSTRVYGRFSSLKLREWFDKNVLKS